MSKSARGFSMVEILISLAVLGLTVFLYFGLLNSFFWIAESRHRNLAVKIANKKIEELRSLPFDQLPPSGSFSDDLLNHLPQASATLILSDYPQTSGAVKQAQININWLERTLPKTIELDTLISSQGIGKR